MEASLLPSKAFRALCKQAVVALARREDSECAELRTEFAIPWLNSWVVVLDAKSETLASWIGDSAGAGCNDRSADKFPGNLVKLIRQSLERPETVEELVRRWRNHPQDMELFEGFAGRLAEMQAFAKLTQVCQDAAADPGLPEQQRNEFRIRAFIAGASAATEKLVRRRARARFVREGERLLVELATHAKSADLVTTLFYQGYAFTFDVPGRSARALARLERASRKLADGTALKERIRQLAEMREQWIAITTESLRNIDEESSRNFIAAYLGDARAAIKVCSRPPYNEDPQFREWLQEARRKRERERKRRGG